MSSVGWARAFASPGLPVLAAILPLQALEQFLTNWGYPAVLLFVMIESTGIPFPGETMLLLGAFFAASGHLSIAGVIAAAATGAILGDNLGYWIGRKGGRPVVHRFGRYVFVREQELATAERFFQRHGDKTVFFGRFISILRAWAAFLAGVNQMRWPIFLFYNAAGGICWAITFGLIGYFLGRTIGVDTIERYASDLGYVVLGLVVVLVVLFLLRRAWRKRSERSASTTDASESPTSPPGSGAQASSQTPAQKDDQRPGA